MSKERIIFMGTPEFAAYALEELIANNYNIVAVITAVDKPAGRGRKMNESAVKKVGLKHHIPILQPPNLKNERFLKALESFNASIQVVVAFRMLPEVVWSMPSKGTFNLHASLLPEYRGAAPINWAIINGETKTGVTTFFIDEKIDTGEIILNEEVDITEDETAGSLHDKLMIIGGQLIQSTIDLIVQNKIKTQPQPQNNVSLKKAPKLFKENCRINWNDNVLKVKQMIHGLSPYPGAWTELLVGDKTLSLKIFKVMAQHESHSEVFGSIKSDKKEIRVYASDGFLSVLELQLQGKRKMNTIDFLNGFSFSEDTKVL